VSPPRPPGAAMDSVLDLLTFVLTPLVGPRTVRDLRERGPLSAALGRPGDHDDLLPEAARSALGSGTPGRTAREQMAQTAKRGERIVGLDDAEYPEVLKAIYDPPPVLWVRGTLRRDEGDRSVAIVGSRAASPHGVTLARTMAADLARA